MYLGPIAESCISYFGRTNAALSKCGTPVFNITGTDYSLEELALAAATALRNDEKFVRLGRVSITPNYIFGMISFATREGWFCDETRDYGQDHSFDPDVPTPGAHWKAACAQREVATTRSALAVSMRKSDFILDRIAARLVGLGANRISRQAGNLARALA